jgi:gliding motility-associated protein GldE
LEGSSLDPGPEQILVNFSQLLLEIDLLFLGANIGIIIILLFASAIISGSEVAFFSLPKKVLEELTRTDKKADKRILKLLYRPKQLLATILILNNFINVTLVIYSTYLVWYYFPGDDGNGKILALLTLVITFLIVFLGELTPKVYANQNNIAFARFTSGILNVSNVIFYPLSFLLTKTTSFIEKRVQTQGYNVSLDKLHKALEMTADEDTTEEEKEILKGIINFGQITAKQIMKSRMDIIALDEEIGYHELLDIINKNGYSRMPVYRETIDDIVGILYIKDLIPYIDEEEGFQWQNLIRKGFFIPETKKIDDLLRDFQEKRVHMAIVVDEYGGTAGIVTLEDVIEEIVGEFNDEFDDEDKTFVQESEHVYTFLGKTSLNDFCRALDVDLNIFDEVKGESESLGGLLLELFAHLPNVGERINFKRFLFTIQAVDRKKIKKIKVEILEKHTVDSEEGFTD